MSSPTPPASASQKLDITQLSTPQLMQIKKQLDEELEHLNGSFNQLRAAQARFGECVRSLAGGVGGAKEGAPILVPLTTSLYVPGTMVDADKVVVDVGTGFFVEKTISEASKFYNDKIKEIGANLKDLEGILQGKSNNLRVVEDVLRQKVLQGQGQGAGQDGAPASASVGA